MLFDDDDNDPKLKERQLIHIKLTNSDELSKYYHMKEILGKGSFGTVKRAVQINNHVNWAIKIICKDKAPAFGVKMIEREIRILKMVEHPHIIHLERVLESTKSLFMVFELCNDVLSKMFRVKKRFSDQETRTVIRSLANAVSYLHQNDIVHRDIKLENILLTVNPQDPNDYLFIKLTDFGLSVVKGGVGMESFMQEMCGTPAYMAPELLDEKTYSNQCDTWSIGVIMYLLLSGTYPFVAPHEKDLSDVICNEELTFNKYPWFGSCSGSAMLIHKMLRKNPAFRITPAEIEKSSWIMNLGEGSQNNVMELMHLWKDDLKDPTTKTRSALELPKEENLLDMTNTYLLQHASMEQNQRSNMIIRKTFGEATESKSSHSEDLSEINVHEKEKNIAESIMICRSNTVQVKGIYHPVSTITHESKTSIKGHTLSNIMEMPTPFNQHDSCFQTYKEIPTTSFGVVVTNTDSIIDNVPKNLCPPIIYNKKKPNKTVHQPITSTSY